jgi:2-hydroxy-3-keto-5-methylthiopentenyl-1-phosphate phosphatase
MKADYKMEIDIVVSDFNGTISTVDLARVVLSNFATPGWEKYDKEIQKGRITFRQCFTKQYCSLNARSKKEIIRFLDESANVSLRLGFKGFVRYCSKLGIEFIIASKGLDFTLQYVLDSNGVQPRPKLECPKSKVENGNWRVIFPSSPGFRNFKEAIVHSYKKKGRRVCFIGDDSYDFWACKRSDLVFAVRDSALDLECQKMKLTHHAFRNFSELEKFIL